MNLENISKERESVHGQFKDNAVVMDALNHVAKSATREQMKKSANGGKLFVGNSPR